MKASWQSFAQQTSIVATILKKKSQSPPTLFQKTRILVLAPSHEYIPNPLLSRA